VTGNERELGKLPLQVYTVDIAKRELYPTSALVPQEVRTTITKQDCLIPPIDRAFPSLLEKLDPTHKSALDVKSIATSQKGYHFTGDNRKFRDFIKKPNYDSFQSLQDILDAFVYEYYVYDEAYLEIVRIADKVSMFIAPARYLYLKINKQGRIIKYCYVTDTGDVTELEPYNGGELKNGVRYIVGMKVYNTSSYYYGYPAYMSAIEAILENSYIRRYGITFFANDATPRKVLIMKGGMLSKEHKKEMQDYLKENYKGLDNAHRLLVITLDDQDDSAEFVDLSSRIDGNFLDEYRKNRDEIISVHQIPPKLMGISVAAGLSTGTETIGSLRDFVERTIAPRQNKLSMFFSNLFSSMFNAKIDFAFDKVDTTNAKDEAIVNNIYAKIMDKEGKPVLTVTEIREFLGLPDEPKGAWNSPDTGKAPNSGSIEGQNTYENPDDISSARGR